MVSFAKNVKYKTLGSKKVSFFALTDVVLEAEVILYNQALGYLEDDIRYLSFTPKMLIFGANVTLVEDRVDSSPNFKQNSNLGGGGGGNFTRNICAKFGTPNSPQSQDIGKISDKGISNFWILGQFLIKVNYHNSRVSDDIEMNLGPITKLDKRNKTTSKKLDDDFMSVNCDFIVIFQFMANSEQSGSRIPDF